MDYVCGPLILVSQDKIRMMDFLSDVFEFDVDTENDTITKGPLSLKLVEENKHKAPLENVQQGITFAFTLKQKEQVDEILSKFNFFLYRKSQDPENERLKFKEIDHDNGLMIHDFDGRTWKFDVSTQEKIHEF